MNISHLKNAVCSVHCTGNVIVIFDSENCSAFLTSLAKNFLKDHFQKCLKCHVAMYFNFVTSFHYLLIFNLIYGSENINPGDTYNEEHCDAVPDNISCSDQQVCLLYAF